MKHHFVFLSGGPDGCAVLKELLSKTDDLISCFHLDLGRDKRRQKMENWAVKEQTTYLRENYREFELYTAEANPSTSSVCHDLVLVATMASGIIEVLNPPVTDVYSGSCDCDFKAHDADNYPNDMAAQELLRTLAGIYKFPVPTYHGNTGRNKSKKDIRLELGEELWCKTWSCRTPDTCEDGNCILSCNKCWGCTTRAEAYDKRSN